MFQVFISICTVGLVWISLVLPETKGIPLEEVAALFGDQDEVMVFTEDVQLGDGEDELVVKDHHHDRHGQREIGKEAEETVHQEVVKLSV